MHLVLALQWEQGEECRRGKSKKLVFHNRPRRQQALKITTTTSNTHAVGDWDPQLWWVTGCNLEALHVPGGGVDVWVFEAVHCHGKQRLGGLRRH